MYFLIWRIIWMITRNGNIVACYNNEDIGYLDKLISILSLRIPKIRDFFKIDFNDDIVIKLYSDLNEYRNNLISSFEKNAQKESQKVGYSVPPRKYEEWMIANTEDGNINMQSLDLVRSQEDFKNYTEEEFCYNACHEFVHLCQEKVNSENPAWFWEVIASSIGNPECQHEIDYNFTLNDMDNFDSIDGYGACYTLGKYLFSNYDSDFILSMIKDNSVFNDNIGTIISEVNRGNIKKY